MFQKMLQVGSGGSGGSGNIMKLYEYNRTSYGSSVTLSDSIENYKFIYIDFGYGNYYPGQSVGQTIIPTEVIKERYSSSSDEGVFWVVGGNVDQSMKFRFTNATTITILSRKNASQTGIYAVYGIN